MFEFPPPPPHPMTPTTAIVAARVMREVFMRLLLADVEWFVRVLWWAENYSESALRGKLK